MGGCLACHTKPKHITVDEPPPPPPPLPPKRVANQGRAVRKPSISEDFWTSSTFDMDNSAVQSQGSISSISTINQTLDPNSGACATNSSEFVNHGLLLWNQTRQRWLGNKRSENRSQQIREPKLSTHSLCMVKSFWLCSWNATYESLLGSNKPFPQPIPLAEMVDFLVDIWEQEGMYD
ncbi:uncharacterized protein LOC21408465 isoform X1 [Morus notabilis]|uniref:uncharacterized protein LOC21408465 isoform X1 n=1 Tax=Morus notabilis TaxID=981085 RepID=UPI000CED2E5E|nr:uncharacterized protein LOC21408465 isoform X1 [Morus notabilis]XP_024021877.1 uncharacterized protein LOC21408465 isoform X1 [Morus notabilis]XP_024021878.1 uncharacterized protein LOC21408465 isoform X1 [Morus notabilis]